MPVGTVCAWLKSYTNTPALDSRWVECNGQVLNDALSVYNGQTIPDLNGSSSTHKFLRGMTTSGGTGGGDTTTLKGGPPNDFGVNAGTWQNSWDIVPTYYGVVWVMKVRAG